jgi:GT2 family glycosyltransferase
MSQRPAAAVIVPFAGSDEQLAVCLAALERLTLGPGDELIVANNTGRVLGPRGTRVAGELSGPPGIRMVDASGARTPAFARNRGVAATDAEWIVFIDADTRPAPDLLDGYFDPLPSPETAILAGGIEDRAGGRSLAARHSARRGQMSQRVTLQRAGTPYAQSANLAVRRAAFAAVGGFDEGARAGEDADLCWRLRAAGWELEERPSALVAHATRATLGALLVQLARHGSGAAWLDRRYPGEFPAPSPGVVARRVAHGLRGAMAHASRSHGEAARVALLELLEGCAFDAGRLLLSNRPRRI